MKQIIIYLFLFVMSCTSLRYQAEMDLRGKGYEFICMDSKKYAFHTKTFDTILFTVDGVPQYCDGGDFDFQ